MQSTGFFGKWISHALNLYAFASSPFGDYNVQTLSNRPAIGTKRFAEDDISPLIQIVKKEGIEIII